MTGSHHDCPAGAAPDRLTAPVSVVVPCYRAAGTLARAVASVLDQTVPPRELWLVVDGNGDDNATRELARRLHAAAAGPTAVEVIELPSNRGPAAARNAGWDRARQPYLAWLDADDQWHPRKLERQWGWLAARPQVDLVGHLQPQYAPGAQAAEPADGPAARRLTRRQIVRSNPLPTSTVLLRRDLPYRFSAALGRCEDHLLWAEMALDGRQLWRIEQPLAWMHKPALGAGGLSADRWAMRRGELAMYWELYRQARLSPAALAWLWPWSLAKHAGRLIWPGARSRAG